MVEGFLVNELFVIKLNKNKHATDALYININGTGKKKQTSNINSTQLILSRKKVFQSFLQSLERKYRFQDWIIFKQCIFNFQCVIWSPSSMYVHQFYLLDLKHYLRCWPLSLQ